MNYEIVKNKKRAASVILTFISAFLGLGFIYYALMLIIQGTKISLYHVIMTFSGAYLILVFLRAIFKDNEMYIFSIVSNLLLGISSLILGIMKISEGDNIASIITIFIFSLGLIFTAFIKKSPYENKKIYLFSIVLLSFSKLLSIILSQFSFLGAITQKGIIITNNSVSYSLISTLIVIFIAISQTIYYLSFEKNEENENINN